MSLNIFTKDIDKPFLSGRLSNLRIDDLLTVKTLSVDGFTGFTGFISLTGPTGPVGPSGPTGSNNLRVMKITDSIANGSTRTFLPNTLQSFLSGILDLPSESIGTNFGILQNLPNFTRITFTSSGYYNIFYKIRMTLNSDPILGCVGYVNLYKNSVLVDRYYFNLDNSATTSILQITNNYYNNFQINDFVDIAIFTEIANPQNTSLFEPYYCNVTYSRIGN